VPARPAPAPRPPPWPAAPPLPASLLARPPVPAPPPHSAPHPPDLPHALSTSRLRRNLGYLRVNYAAVVAFSLAASLLAHLFSLLVLLSILGAWCFLYVFRASDQPIVLFGRTFTDRETLLGLV
ncbi:hypothetical protein BAE44_0012008, partial [Dichanthelium oligosanthes]